ncbi:hypothetical protein LMG24238_02424 [Paraburkholderia sediminicola]|uniref:Uncharacterized protein n=2 Tax=Paraburkholderia sediminicola TaxID=458836 RepID=A0A6J5APN6_9BURK|nr:hypothetical protein LMG24238_02424 [Paraburkholderia sediminicola]
MNLYAYPSDQGSMSSLVTTADKVKGDTVAQWMERCYWGDLASGSRYTDSSKEQSDFSLAMADA